MISNTFPQLGCRSRWTIVIAVCSRHDLRKSNRILRSTDISAATIHSFRTSRVAMAFSAGSCWSNVRSASETYETASVEVFYKFDTDNSLFMVTLKILVANGASRWRSPRRHSDGHLLATYRRPIRPHWMRFRVCRLRRTALAELSLWAGESSSERAAANVVVSRDCTGSRFRSKETGCVKCRRAG